MAPAFKYHDEKAQVLSIRLTPTGRKDLVTLYIGDGKLASCISSFLEELAMGNLVASRPHVCEAVPGISEGTGEALTKSQAHIALLSAELAKTKKLLQDSDLGVASRCSSRVNFSD